MLKLELINKENVEVEAEFFEEYMQKAEEIVGKRAEGEINLILSDDEEIRTLNREYRGKDKATDVLSFPYLEEGMVGDIMISVPTAKRQAEERGHDLKEELKALFVHGLLHLFGFDHQTDEEEAEMEGFAKKIIE